VIWLEPDTSGHHWIIFNQEEIAMLKLSQMPHDRRVGERRRGERRRMPIAFRAGSGAERRAGNRREGDRRRE
jgi:hypothetical protein